MLPRGLGVNEYIALFAKNLRKSLVTFDADVGSLTIKSFLLAGQLDGQSLQLQAAHLRNEQPILLAGKQRMIADFNDRRANSGMLAKLGKKKAERPDADPSKGNQQARPRSSAAGQVPKPETTTANSTNQTAFQSSANVAGPAIPPSGVSAAKR